MSKPLKYGNKKVRYDFVNQCLENPATNPKDCIIFDSILEYNVYLQIIRVVKPEFVTIHHPLLIWTASKRYHDFTWCCDFAIRLPKGVIFVEAKGMVTDEFKHRLRALDKFTPEVFDRLLIVNQLKKKICGNGKHAVYSVPLNQMHESLYLLVKKYE